MEHDEIIISDSDEIGQPTSPSIWSGVLNNAAFRQQLAQSMAAPIRRQLDYAGIARRVFSVEPLPQGAVPIYFPSDKEEDV